MSGAHRVVMGLDSLDRANGLLEHAAGEAGRRGLPLTVVTVLLDRADRSLSAVGLAAEDRRLRVRARQRLCEAAQWVRARHPGIAVDVSCLAGDDVGGGSGPLAEAGLLVVGAHGRYGRPALGLGTVSRTLMKAAACPVLVVPEHSPAIHADAPVLAGVGGHHADVEAEAEVVAAALEQARLLGKPLHVLHAIEESAGSRADPAALLRARAYVRRVVDAAGLRPTDQVSITVVQEDPVPALSRRADVACLLVVGSRPGAAAGLLPDSVSHAVLRSAACPILVVPRRGRPDARSVTQQPVRQDRGLRAALQP